MSRPYVALVAAIVSLPLFAAPGGSVDAKFLKEQVRCARTQIKETGRLGACAYKAADKALRKGLPMLDVSACVARFYDRWAKAEARANARYGPGTCRSAVDPLVVEGAIAQAFSRTVAGISGVRFVDMGFAVVDNATNLMWIKTDDAGGVTDWDNAYSWSPDATVGDATRNGTAFTSYLEQLNGCTTSATGYGSYCDWRIPQPGELASIVDCTAGPSCIDEGLFGPTKPGFYWTNSPAASDQRFVQTIDFSDGSQPTLSAAAGIAVRAVRHDVGFLF